MSPSSPRPRSPLRTLAFATTATLLVLAGGNALLGALDEAGVLNTHNPDDVVQFVDKALFEESGDQIKTTRYAEDSMVAQSFAREKGEALRVFIVGASFAMGTPYVNQGRPGQSGGIGSFVEAELRRRLPDRPIEVVNAASGGADSGRVTEVALQVLEQEPDALFIATCNNDSHVDPGQLRRLLQEQAGYRLLSKLLRSQSPEERQLFAPGDVPSRDLERQLVRNITTVLDAAEQRGVPVLLATLPVNLRYPGFDPVGAGGSAREAADLLFDVPHDKAPSIPPNLTSLPACEGGIWLAWAGEDEASIPLLIRCAVERDGVGMLPPFAPSYLAMAELRTGRVDDWAEDVLRATWGDCLTDGMMLYQRQEWDAAVDGLLKCEELGEALQWAGLSRWKQGQHADARSLLRQAVELDPRNRCRPSLNQAIRRLAGQREGVTLVDLETHAESIADDGLPGWDLFLDSCHMSWRGYAGMAESLIHGLETALPQDVPPANSAPRFEEDASRMGLPAGGNIEQVLHILAPPDMGPPPDGR